MEDNIKEPEDRNYIVLTVVGKITGQGMMKNIFEAHALGNELGTTRYPSDATEARNIDSVMGNQGFAYSDMKKTEGVDTLARRSFPRLYGNRISERWALFKVNYGSRHGKGISKKR